MAIIEGTTYAYVLTLQLPFLEARKKVEEVFSAQGFGVISEIDVQVKMKEKLGEEMPAYVILGMCNPRLAMRSLEADPNAGVLLPCNVIVRSIDNGTVIAAQRPETIAESVGNPKVGSIAAIADALIVEALKAL